MNEADIAEAARLVKLKADLQALGRECGQKGAVRVSLAGAVDGKSPYSVEFPAGSSVIADLVRLADERLTALGVTVGAHEKEAA